MQGPRLETPRLDTATHSVALVVPLAERKLRDDWLETTLAGERPDELRIAASEVVPDAILTRLERKGCTVERSGAPRGSRLRHAASKTKGKLVVFLHADTRLPHGAIEQMRRQVDGRHPWGAFKLRFENEQRRRHMGVVAFGANVRSRLFGLPFGDQAPFATRDAYEAIGGHPPWNFLDDLELSLRLRRLARPLLIDTPVWTSSRRYRERGGVRTIWTNARILTRFALGALPDELETLYRGAQTRGTR